MVGDTLSLSTFPPKHADDDENTFQGRGRPGAPQSASEEIRLRSKRVRFTADARPHLWPMRDGQTDGREAKDVMSDAMRPAGRT